MRVGTREIAMGAAALVLAALPTSDAAAGWRPRLGFEAGSGLTRMHSAAPLDETERWSAGAAAGVVAEWPLAAGWSLGFAPRWERLVGRTEGAFDVTLSPPGSTWHAEYDQRIRFDRIGLPLRAAFRPPGAGGLVLEAGAHVAWLVHAGRDADLTVIAQPASARTGRPAAQIFEELGTFDEDDWTRNFHRWDLAVVAGVGWDRPLGGPVGGPVLGLRGRAQQGLVDISKFSDDSRRLTSVELTVGLLW